MQALHLCKLDFADKVIGAIECGHGVANMASTINGGYIEGYLISYVYTHPWDDIASSIRTAEVNFHLMPIMSTNHLSCQQKYHIHRIESIRRFAIDLNLEFDVMRSATRCNIYDRRLVSAALTQYYTKSFIGTEREFNQAKSALGYIAFNDFYSAQQCLTLLSKPRI